MDLEPLGSPLALFFAVVDVILADADEWKL